jgi:hypothetical protein
MKIILLIIASENEHKYYEMKEFWKTYMNIHPNIQSYFLYNKPDNIVGLINNKGKVKLQ